MDDYRAEKDTGNTSAPQAIATLLRTHGVDLDWQRPLYETFHANPELSGMEVETAARIKQQLNAFDCEVTGNIGGHGIVAIFRNGPGPVALMRADFDGLPVLETTGAPFASTKTRINKDGV